VTAGKADLHLEVHTVAGTDVMAPLVGLQQVMRRTEAQMAETLAGTEGWIVLVDGPVSFLPPALQDSARCPVVGLVKRMTQAYLSGAEAALLPFLPIVRSSATLIITTAVAAIANATRPLRRDEDIRTPVLFDYKAETTGECSALPQRTHQAEA
jgi:hypothetical protein